MPDRIRALYVDDEPGLLEVARLFLEQSPEIKVETAESAKLALSFPGIASYDAIVSDYQMPDMDGIAFLKAVREKYGEIPFILFTGRGREEVVIQAINNGADFYIQKGGDPTAQFAELTHKIRQAVSRRRAQDELKAAYEQITASEEELRTQYGELAKREQQIRTDEEQLTSVYNTVGDSIFQIAVEPGGTFRFSSINSAFCRVTGLTPEQIIGRRVSEIIPEPSLSLVLEKYWQAIRENAIVRWEEISDYPRGRLIGEVSIAPVFDKDGTCTHLIGSVHDITEHKKSEEQLHEAYEKISASEEELRHQYEELASAQKSLVESREQMAEIADTVPGVVYQSRFHPGGKEEFLFLSSRVPEVFGISADRSDFTERFFARVDPRDRDLLDRSIREAVSKSLPWEFEGRFTKPSGEAIWFQGLARPVHKATGLYYNGVLLDITRRKRAEEAIRENAAKLREAQEMAHLGFWSWDIATGNVEWSDEVFRIFGLDQETFRPTIDSILARSPWAEEQNRAKELMQKAMESRKPGSYEQRFLRPDNSTGYYYSTFQGRYDENGALTALVGTVLDITERKKAEMELRAGEDRYRSIIEHAPYGMHFYRLDPKKGLVFAGANPAADRILGVRHEQFVGKNIEEAFPGLEGTGIPAHYRNVAETGDTWKVENTVYEKGRIHGIYDVTAFRTAPYAMAAMFVDITERKKAEEALHEKTEEMDQFFTASLDLFCIADADGTFRRLNPEWERALGYTLAELKGHRFFDFVHPDDLPSTLAAVSDLSSQRNVLNFVNRNRHRDGSYRWIEWRALPRGDLIFAAARDITEHKLFEDALQESKAEQRAILEGSPVLQFVIGRDHRIMAWNKALEKYSGIPAADVVGTDRQWRAFYPEKRPVLADLLIDNNTEGLSTWYGGKLNPAPHVEGGYEAMDFFPAMGSSGTWLLFTAAPIRDADGTIIGAVETLSDVTDRVRATEALRESEDKYRSLVDVSPVAVAVHRDGKIVYANPEAVRLLKAGSAGELVGKGVLTFIHPDYHNKALEDFRIMAGEGIMIPLQEEVLLKVTGEPFTVEVVAKPIRYEGLPSVLVAFRDITERKTMEVALLESEEKYRTIIEHATEAIVIIQDSRIVYANPRVAELSGIPEADLIGTPFLDLVWPDDRTLLKDRHRRRIAGEDVPSRYDFRFIGPHGKVRWISLSVALIPWQGRLATINLMNDITERKLAEAALREAGRKLALLNSVTRHDIKNQLITLQGFAQFARKKEQDPILAGYLAKIDTSATTIGQQIEFMKIYQELGANSAAWFRLDKTVGKAAMKEVPCSCSCSGFEVFSDPMLEKVFLNLVDNALRHGGHVTEIVVRCGETGDGHLLVVVEDNGVGISEDEKKKIFEKGYGKNTGFGLFLVREILSITGITIRENGAPGKGARFEILVPKECWRKTEL